MPLNQNASANQAAQNQPSKAQQTPVSHSTEIPVTTTAGHDMVVKNQPYHNIEEKIAQLSLQLNQVFVKPYLQQALDYLKSSKLDAINSYNQLSDQVAGEIRIISQNTQIINLRLKDAESIINKTQEIIRNKYSNANEEEISGGQLDLEYEYNLVAEHYEATLQLSQELSNYKARVVSLNSLQSLLDKSMIPFVSRLQLEVDNLELLIHNFDSSDYADIIAKKHGVNFDRKIKSNTAFIGRSQELNKLTEQFNSEIETSPKIEQFKRVEEVNQQKLDTFVEDKKSAAHLSNNETVRSTVGKTVHTTTDNQKVNRPFDANTTAKSQADYESDSEYQLSRQEQKLMRRLRQQQIQMEHTIKMNQMIYEYNKSVDDMMKTQYEYEQKFNAKVEGEQPQFTQASKSMQSDQTFHQPQVRETQANIETLREHVDNGNNDRLFVVRNNDQISEEEAKQLSKKFGTKSIRVVK